MLKKAMPAALPKALATSLPSSSWEGPQAWGWSAALGSSPPRHPSTSYASRGGGKGEVQKGNGVHQLGVGETESLHSTMGPHAGHTVPLLQACVCVRTRAAHLCAL